MNINSGVYIVLAFFVAFLLTFSATPFIVSMSHKIGAFDMPDNKRKIHKKPIPRIGGLAIFYGFFVSTICFSILDKDLISILLGGALIMCLGVSDDIKPIKARYKLLVQILAACIPIFFGVKISHLSIPSLFSKDKFIVLNSFFSNFITLFWIVGITNAINLIDGLDGLAVGISSIASTSMLALTFLLSEFNTAILTAAVAGAGFGFLPFNFNPAKILMGDCGSTFLGFLLACTSIEGFFKTEAMISILVPVLILALPIFDTSFAILRRLARKKPIMLPDRGHLHHVLVDSGFSQKKATGVLYTISASLSLSAVVMLLKDATRGFILIASILFLLVIGTKYMLNRGKIN